MRDELSLLGAQLIYKKRLEAILAELLAQQSPLEKKVQELKIIMQNERRDVDRLESRSLAAFVYYALGKKEEKLDTERREYYAARVKFDAASRELEAIRQDIASTQEDLMDLRDCEAKYAEALEQKRRAIEEAGLPVSEAVVEKRKNLGALHHLERELEEALTAGYACLYAVGDVNDALRSAEEWNALDIFGNAAFIDAAKREKLDDAQKSVEELQVQLQRFNKEMSDITIRSNLQVSMENLLKFADFFFDNLFTDLNVLDKIKQSRSQVDQTRDQILGVLRQLQTQLEEVRHKQAKLKAELDEMIVNITL